jgi:hypothetical protein
LGARDAVAYLADLQQLVLVPFTGPAGPGPERHLEPLAIDSTPAGRSFQHVEVVTHASAAGAGTRVWMPLLDGTERLGVLGVTLSERAALDGSAGCWGCGLRRFASIVAELVVSKTLYGDTIVCTRRRLQMGLAAEMQWAMPPPLTFATRRWWRGLSSRPTRWPATPWTMPSTRAVPGSRCSTVCVTGCSPRSSLP